MMRWWRRRKAERAMLRFFGESAAYFERTADLLDRDGQEETLAWLMARVEKLMDVPLDYADPTAGPRELTELCLAALDRAQRRRGSLAN